MFVKRYIANDMSEAMEKIRKELGPEAVILSHRTMRKKGVTGFMSKKLVEVMVAYEPAADRTLALETGPVQTVAEPELMPEKLRTRPQEQNANVGKARFEAIAGGREEQLPPLFQKEPAGRAQPREGATAAPPMQPYAQPTIRQTAAPVWPAIHTGGGPEAAPGVVASAAAVAQAAPQQMQGIMQYQQAAIQARHTTQLAEEPMPIPQPVRHTPAQHLKVESIERIGMGEEDVRPQRLQSQIVQAAPAMPAANAPAGGLQDEAATRMQKSMQNLERIIAEAANYQSESGKRISVEPLTPMASEEDESLGGAFEALEFTKLTSVLPEQTPYAGSEEKIDELHERLAALKGVVSSLTSKIITGDKAGVLQFTPAVMSIYNSLIEQDVQEELARGIAERVQSLQDETGQDPISVAEVVLLNILGKPATLIQKAKGRTVVLLMGPTGVGKTTTLVKLAGQYAIKEGMKAGFINTDTYRVAAQEQLKIYADIMDIPCCTVYTPDEIPMALHALSDCDLVLIDTAGKSMADRLYREELSALIRESGADEVILHVSASMSANASMELLQYFSFIDNCKLVVTKLDEIHVWGSIVNIAAYARRPICFVTTGQKVPQDIEAPNMKSIVKRLLESAGS